MRNFACNNQGKIMALTLLCAAAAHWYCTQDQDQDPGRWFACLPLYGEEMLVNQVYNNYRVGSYIDDDPYNPTKSTHQQCYGDARSSIVSAPSKQEVLQCAYSILNKIKDGVFTVFPEGWNLTKCRTHWFGLSSREGNKWVPNATYYVWPEGNPDAPYPQTVANFLKKNPLQIG